ncbi:formylmethanofuran dehydrogenase, subunit E [Methanothermus fervidus DSM 2088]|uniref:Formylmethanofuran dehydrogenase, subunit E n=1 Tax=Methanothermus fervidus (strain ATCC 43054 / DSM 2088 / JCM 10308 / V24 S) TaxID=523846 RepID=E3GWI4_METFV|nr:FmdE family protein [Methanothermus fervidus]ADP77949.1 formylmethanofuran dehydrogenase, subunit E [Methanothermus fervidus DSM 2088]
MNIEIDTKPFLKYIRKIEKFTGFASPGSVIGTQMYMIAKKLLNFKEDEDIYVTCETSNCLPDAFQAICKSTIGNGKLSIYDTGKMAVTINKKGAPGETVKGVRIILDPNKTRDYPIIHKWYFNTEKVPAEKVIPELIKAGAKIYSWEYKDVKVPKNTKKVVKICKICKEPYIARNEYYVCPQCHNKKKEG